MNVKYGLLVEKKEFKLKKDYAKEIFINFNDQDVNNIIGTVFYYSLTVTTSSVISETIVSFRVFISSLFSVSLICL